VTSGPHTALTISFGPAATPTLSRAVSLARAHAEEVREEGGTWHATFHLGPDQAPYGWALQLLYMVGGWRSTTVQVGGSPESRGTVQAMLSCAREWLRDTGACRAAFPPGRLPAKCRPCPLYDRGWAVESWVTPRFGLLRGFGDEEPRVDVPDYVPDDWT
jgi:hypothetical protein